MQIHFFHMHHAIEQVVLGRWALLFSEKVGNYTAKGARFIVPKRKQIRSMTLLVGKRALPKKGRELRFQSVFLGLEKQTGNNVGLREPTPLSRGGVSC